MPSSPAEAGAILDRQPWAAARYERDLLAQHIFHAFARYAWNEAECFPSHKTIADEVGCARETVTRKVSLLRAAGQLNIKERRWSKFTGWTFNVYELLGAFKPIGVPTVKRMVRKAHNTKSKMARRRKDGRGIDAPCTCRIDVPKNTSCSCDQGTPGWCGCAWCRPDRAQIGRAPPRVFALDTLCRLRKKRAEEQDWSKEGLREEVRRINATQGSRRAPGAAATGGW